jgi:ketosteroid isomerase-like protein
VVVGRDAIRRHMQGAFSDPAVQLRWEPTKAEVSSAGDMGYTYGRWQIVARDSAGAEQERARGKYITVWKRAPTGEWKVAVDGGNQEPRASR